MFDKKRGAERAPKMKCPHCQNEYTLGVNGTVQGCDDCTGTERASNGFALSSNQCCCFEIQGDNDDCPKHGKGKK